MSGHQKFSELTKDQTPEQRARVDAEKVAAQTVTVEDYDLLVEDYNALNAHLSGRVAELEAALREAVAHCEDCGGSAVVIHEGTPWPVVKALGGTKPDVTYEDCATCAPARALLAPPTT